MNTYAVVVGIEKYSVGADWDVDGPCTNAIAIAHWLLSLKMPPGNIRAFLDPNAVGKDAAIAALEQEGVTIVRSVKHADIDEYFHVTLPTGRPPDSRLLVYWSGHGCTNERGDRIFFCGDYHGKLPSRVFNGSTFLRALRGEDHRCFTDQIVLADVCGTYNKSPVVDARIAPEHQQNVHQLVYFATPEDKYAEGPEGRGVFTDTSLSVLEAIGGWPEHARLVQEMEAAFKQIGETPFRIQSYADGHADPERPVGRAAPGNSHFHSVLDLLHRLDVVSSVYLPHYQRTAAHNGIPPDGAEGLIGIVRGLSSTRDQDLSKGVPRALLEFLLRLAKEERLAKPIGDWLAQHAAAQQNTLDEIREMLAIEAQRKILVVKVKMDNETREIAGLTAHLRTSDFVPVPDWLPVTRPAVGWPEFIREMQTLLAEFVVEGRLQNLEIHFVVDPPLFDRPFHTIPLTGKGRPIGQQAVVILRHRRRALPSIDNQLLKLWNDYAKYLRSRSPRKMKWLKIEAGGAALPAKKGLCFARFVLPPVHEGGAACESEKDLLERLLDTGAPYLCLPHALPAGCDWDKLERDLNKLLRKLATIDEFPSAFSAERLNGSELAAKASILWDDPLAKLFGQLKGVGI
jgi:hypothetical protein